MVANKKRALRAGARHGIARALFAFTATATIAGGIVGAGGASAAWASDVSVQPTPEAVRAQGYNKVSFQDEFDGDAVDNSKWGYQYSCFDPSAKTQTHYTDSPDNVSVSGGNLHLVARYSPTREKWNKATRRMETVDRTCTRTEGGKKIEYKAPFTSAMIQTKDDKGNVKYAAHGDFYAEARIKLPAGRSSWSSFWMTGIKGQWPNNGEIDVFESKGWDSSYLQANVHTPRASDPAKSSQQKGQLGGDGTSQSNFHTYGVEKNGDSITFYLDGVRGHTVKYADLKGFNPFTVDGNGMILRLNQMVGGTFLANDDGSNTDYVDATKHVSDYEGAGSEMLVDYVRVWEKDLNAPVVTETPAPEPTIKPAPAPEPTASPAPEPTVNPAPSTEPTPAHEPTKPADNNAGNATDVDTGHPGEGTPASRPVENTTGDNSEAEKPDTPRVNDSETAGDTGKPADKPGDKTADKQPETPAPSVNKPTVDSDANKPAPAPEPTQPTAQPETPGTTGTSTTPSGNTNVASKPGEATQGKGEGYEQPFRAAEQATGEAGTGGRQVGAAGGSQGVGVHSASELPSTGGNVLVVVAAVGSLVAAAAVGLAALVVNRKSKRG